MQVTLEPWRPADLTVLRRANTPEMTRFLGGPEPEEALAARHAEYLAPGDAVRMFRIEVDGATAGYAGWWEEEHEGVPVYEIGCAVEPAFQGRGVASITLTEVVRRAASAGEGRPIVGYANVDNTASNTLCERVGFSLVGSGVFAPDDGDDAVAVNVWMIDTSA